MTPSIGRIVIYHHIDGRDFPAVVVRVWSNDMVNLAILRDDTAVGYGNTFATSVARQLQGGDAMRNTWSWPEHVE